MMEIKIEYNCLLAGKKSALGLMLEVTAPESPADDLPKAREPKGIVFVVDRSGSMGGGRLELVKQTIVDMLPRLGEQDYLSVVTFDDFAKVELPLTQIKSTKLADLRKHIGDIQPGGSTNLHVGYLNGIEEAKKAPSGVETTLVLLSDGEANAGIVDAVVLGQIAAGATEHLITTSTIGIGEGYDETILNAMAISGTGNHFAAYRLEEAVDGLNDEIDGMLKKTISNLKIEIEAIGRFNTEQFKVRKTQYLRDFKTLPGKAIANLGDLASKEEKNFVFEVTLPGVGVDETVVLEAISVRYFYEDLILARKIEGGQRFELTVATANDYVEPAHDEDIVAELQGLRLQDLKEEAVRLMQIGRGEEARELLRKAGEDFEKFLQNLDMISPRNYDRMMAQRTEFSTLSMLQNDGEFYKRSAESINRGRKSKPDPRKEE